MLHRSLLVAPVLVLLSACSAANSGPQLPTMLDAQGVTISQIAIYQGPKLVLMGGMETGAVTVPIIAGRDALVRVFVQTDATYDSSPVTAELFIGQGSKPIEVVAPVTGAGTDDTLESTINFEVPGAVLVPGATYRVELRQPSAHTKGQNPGASYPAGTAQDPLPVTSDGASLKVVIVPISYGGDGSNRLPDTSATQLQGYTDLFMATYPVDKIDLTVHAPFPWSAPVGPDGTGWSELLAGLADYRQKQGAPPDTYYYGAFQPAASFGQYCGAGCVAGLGLIGMATDNYSRAAVGLGYPDGPSLTTAIHEVGHTQGRSHAPCGGANNVDPQFPYAKGDIGDWGYDLVTKELYAPGKASDMMGYCTPVWISDYTFNAIFERMKTINNAEILYPPGDVDRVWERARVDMKGDLAWLDPIQLPTPPVGEPTQVTVETAGGAAAVAGQFFPYDHLPGGVLFWPAGSSPATSVRATVGGVLRTSLDPRSGRALQP